MPPKERVERLGGVQCGGSYFDLMELTLADQLVDGSAAKPECLGNLIQFVCFAVQCAFSLLVV